MTEKPHFVRVSFWKQTPKVLSVVCVHACVRVRLRGDRVSSVELRERKSS